MTGSDLPASALLDLADRGRAPRSQHRRLSIPCSVFRTEVRAHDVASVTATGETIQGQLRQQDHLPARTARGRRPALFKTERPVFANDDLFQQLLAEGATVGANPTGRSHPVLGSRR